MTVQQTQVPPPGWYHDPQGAARLRYWDGERWTEQFQPVPSAIASPKNGTATERPTNGANGTAPASANGSAAKPPARDGSEPTAGPLRRRPVLWIAIAASVALVAGVGIGLAGQQPALDDERAKVEDLQGDLRAATSERDDARRDLAGANQRIQKLTARGQVPNFAGQTVQDAEALATEYDWTFKVRTAPSDKPRGEVLSQIPREGTMLGRGRSITLVTAVPRPKEWRTVESFSGSGSERTNEFQVPAGKVRVKYAFTGDTNAILSLNSPGGDEFGGDLLLNEIGNHSGETRLYNSEGERYLEIQGGSWTVEIQVFK